MQISRYIVEFLGIIAIFSVIYVWSLLVPAAFVAS